MSKQGYWILPVIISIGCVIALILGVLEMLGSRVSQWIIGVWAGLCVYTAVSSSYLIYDKLSTMM